MYKTILPLLAVALLVGAATAVPAQDPAAAPPAKGAVNAQGYVVTMVGFMSSPDPRLRYSVREAMVVMGPQAISAINAAKGKEKNPKVKAFMTRTVAFIKNRQSRRGGQFQRGGRNRQRTVDIDRIAMDANLTWEQMDKVLPILKKSQKDMSDLMAEFREAGGNFRDREAMQDLREEMSAIAKEAEPKLKEFLNETQVKQMKRHVDPWGDRMNRMNRARGGRGGRGERGSRGGERGEGRRPSRGEGGERPIR